MDRTDIDSFSNSILHSGWALVELKSKDILLKVKEELTKYLSEKFCIPNPQLESYHKYVQDNDTHYRIQAEMTDLFRRENFHIEIFKDNKEFLLGAFGPDISIQAKPYLRICRPNCPQDNIGYHRDTFYGGSPYEISFVLPFVDLPDSASLSVATGSHKIKEKDVETIQQSSPNVVKGSELHNLGFLYAPKVIPAQELKKYKMVKVPLKVGEALAFSLSTLHGSENNLSTITRWSMDCRIINTFWPINLDLRPEYYKKLFISYSAQVANHFYSNI